MNSIKLKAHAKINLGLDVVRKREDGYHEVRMIMQTIGLYDKLTITRTNNTSIVMNTNLHYLPTDESNLVYKAVSLIRSEFQIEQGVYVNLEKKIPVAAGMAGGSSDAATALYGMNRLFSLNLTKADLMKLGLKLGADVPYCIMRGTALSEGIGEVLTPLPPFPECNVLIVKPGISVSTKYVYENLKLDENTKHPDIDSIIHSIREKDLYGAVNLFSNVLEIVTEKEYPVIRDIKAKMLELGAVGSLMSGSGPTVFGLFDDIKKAEKAFYQFKISDLGKQVFLTDLYHPRY
ncbi:4-(cytidine 5'-diphospho)-2-C-methyl-D-erythritol kinase [Anaerocolumna sedimenticola]|uniref:4-diphosphocytidyl-2-C-methyl-D-erythritol kinase n=1 Tax=Anaerocolumna sedimenticola TaxID=2696063 RepID=A0A6P1TKG0_9FIRM|nr:4-(cytidine 5'-diphospho)-2-C-methyl-D-erythritol kinase [Anaerocolumna sedimenticola]QHQ60396.1 4-(cytidine 5'-diphospho)-2-C-methyl-D-erythritol kinase [Anaerocolumna sedimenticola]